MMYLSQAAPKIVYAAKVLHICSTKVTKIVTTATTVSPSRNEKRETVCVIRAHPWRELIRGYNFEFLRVLCDSSVFSVVNLKPLLR